MNRLDKDYLELVDYILRFGVEKKDRTGTGTKSIFGKQIRHSMKTGFPLLTTKKMAFKTMVTELLWFLRGDTNIKFLVDNDCHIWDGDAYSNYKRKINLQNNWEVNLRAVGVDTIGQQELLSKEEFINKIKTDNEFAKKWGELGPIYGKQWREWKQFIPYNVTEENCQVAVKVTDQIANSINLLKTDPDSRRNKVSAWNVGELDKMVLPPCHTDFQFYTRELSYDQRFEIFILKNERKFDWTPDKRITSDVLDELNIPTRAISLMWGQRSVDTGLGLSFNIASYGLLLMMIAKQVNMVPDELIGNLGDVHLYLNHIEPIKEQLTREPYELPTVKISDRVVNDISEYTLDDIILENYQSHPTIKMPLSN